MKSAPKIGITCSYLPKKTFLFNEYIKAIIKNGGIPFLIPTISPSYPKNYDTLMKKYVEELDGLFLSGGGDVATGNPKYQYGQKISLKKQNKIRYYWEMALLKEAIIRKRSILGICRGHQMLADYLGLELTKFQKDHYKKRHVVYCAAGTHMVKILRVDKLIVNSFHKQAVINDKKLLGSNFRVSLLSKEKYVEALESIDGKIITTQFHPEKMESFQPLFRYFIKISRESGY